MSAFSIYLLGAFVTGFLFLLLLYINSFESYMLKGIDKAKADFKNSDNCSDSERILVDGLDNNTVINFLIFLYTILSWVGLIFLIVEIIVWIFDLKNLIKK